MFFLPNVEDQPGLEFEWDAGNIGKVVTGHSIPIDEAESIFEDINRKYFKDIKHTGPEIRYICIGKSNQGRVLMFPYTYRGKKIRPITCFPANKTWRKKYDASQH